MILAISGHNLPLHFRQQRPESPPNVLILLDPGLRTSGDTVEDEYSDSAHRVIECTDGAINIIDGGVSTSRRIELVGADLPATGRIRRAGSSAARPSDSPRHRRGVARRSVPARGVCATARTRSVPSCCFSHSLVGSPRELVGVFRRRISWDDGVMREPAGAGGVAFPMNRCCRSGENVDARAPSVGKGWASAAHLSMPCPHGP